jgi:hypothetical protein
MDQMSTWVPFPWPSTKIHPSSVPRLLKEDRSLYIILSLRTCPQGRPLLPLLRSSSGTSPEGVTVTFKGPGRDVTGRAWEHAGKCWKMMINYGCGQGFEGECVFFRRGHMGRRAYFFKDSWFCSWWLIVFGGGDGRWMSMGRCLFLLHQLCFFALSNIEIVSKNIRQCTEIYQALRWKCLKHGSWSWSNYRGLDNCKDLISLVVWNSF